jgi:hypothetical protein
MGGTSLGTDELRAQAIDHVRDRRWTQLLDLQPQLEQDVEYWTPVWGPACAVAAHHEGRPGARELLDSLVDAGFHDLATHAELFADTFAAEPDWPELRARILANVPLPPVELTEWPCAAPVAELGLDRLDPAGERELGRRLPSFQSTAQETALAMLAWVTGLWRHSGANHVPGRDANLVLDRVQAGERFACREYTIVLTQALNALGIPARHLALLREGYHAGMGTGHAVTEAWLDDLGRWVVLDGQNGATWRDADGVLLGVVELQRALRDDRTPTFVGSGPNFDPATAEGWSAYFRHWSTGGVALRSGSFVPLMEGSTVVEARRLLKDAASAHPDLAEISTAVVDVDGVPAVLFGTEHPYAEGFTVVGSAGALREVALGEPLPLGVPGSHTWQVATRTPYGPLRPSPFGYVRRG